MFPRKNKVHPVTKEDSRPAKITNNYLVPTKTLYLCLPQHAEDVIYTLEKFTQSMKAEKYFLNDNRLEIEECEAALAESDKLIAEEKITGLKNLLKLQQQPLQKHLESLMLDRLWLAQTASSYLLAADIQTSEMAAVKYALQEFPSPGLSLLKIEIPLTEDPDEKSINSDGEAIVRIDLLKYLVSIKNLSYAFSQSQNNATIINAIATAPEYNKIDLPANKRQTTSVRLATIPEDANLKTKPAKTFNIVGNNLMGFEEIKKKPVQTAPEDEISPKIKSRR